MPVTIKDVESEPLNRETFAPFGDVLAPDDTRLDNRDLLSMGYAKMSDAVDDLWPVRRFEFKSSA